MADACKLPIPAKDVIDLVRSIERDVKDKIIDTYNIRNNVFNVDANLTKLEMRHESILNFIVHINGIAITGSEKISEKELYFISKSTGQRIPETLLKIVERIMTGTIKKEIHKKMIEIRANL